MANPNIGTAANILIDELGSNLKENTKKAVDQSISKENEQSTIEALERIKKLEEEKRKEEEQRY